MAEAGEALNYPTREIVVALNRRHIQLDGGIRIGGDNFLNEGSLLWVLEAIQYPVYYPTLEEKAAQLAWVIITRHVFVDGNKRTGISLLQIFLIVNGYMVIATDQEIINLALDIANQAVVGFTIGEVVEWIRAKMVRL